MKLGKEVSTSADRRIISVTYRIHLQSGVIYKVNVSDEFASTVGAHSDPPI